MALQETPRDEISGLPLLMAPDERILPMLWQYESSRDRSGRVVADWNHCWHPAREIIEAGEGGPAVRNSRIQFVLRKEQHNEYHAAFSGPPGPLNPAARFKAAVLCAAGYIPPQGIHFRSDGPERVNLSEWEMTRLRESGEVKVASFSVVQKFMKEFVLKQPVDHIKPKTINRFLRLNPAESADASERRAYMAHLLLSLVIDQIEEDLMPPYMYAYRSGLLMPSVPKRPDSFVLRNIINNKKTMKGVAAELTAKLTLHRDGPSGVRRFGHAALAAG